MVTVEGYGILKTVKESDYGTALILGGVMNWIEAMKSGKKVVPEDGFWHDCKKVGNDEYIQNKDGFITDNLGIKLEIDNDVLVEWTLKEWVEYSEYKEYTPLELAQMMYDGKRLGSKDGSIIYYDTSFSNPFRQTAPWFANNSKSQGLTDWTDRKWKVLDE